MSDDVKGPGPFTIERIVSAWQRARNELDSDAMLAGDEAALQSALNPAGYNAETQENLDADQLLQRIVTAMLFAALRVAEAGEVETLLKARKQRYAHREEILRRTLLEVMTALARRSFAALEGTVSLRTVSDSILVTDLDAIPPEYVDKRTETIITPRKGAILDDLKQGVVIPGAVLSNGGLTISFRRQRPRGAEPQAAEA
jgi:Siphovirus Gp157